MKCKLIIQIQGIYRPLKMFQTFWEVVFVLFFECHHFLCLFWVTCWFFSFSIQVFKGLRFSYRTHLKTSSNSLTFEMTQQVLWPLTLVILTADLIISTYEPERNEMTQFVKCVLQSCPSKCFWCSCLWSTLSLLWGNFTGEETRFIVLILNLKDVFHAK